jgi:hypothetical protein
MFTAAGCVHSGFGSKPMPDVDVVGRCPVERIGW